MARLINWYGPITEIGSKNNQQLEDQGILEQAEHTFRAEFDEPVPDWFIYQQRQCPQFGRSMVFKNGQVSNRLFAVGRMANQHGDAPQVYDVQVRYANKIVDFQAKPIPFQFIDNPLLRPALIEWGDYSTSEAVEIDLDDNPVCTTAGEPLILVEERSFRKITIQKNIVKVPDKFAKGEYINEEDTTIGGFKFEKLTLWLKPISIGHIAWENGVFYYPITMTIVQNPKTWIRRIRNAGYYMRSLNGKYITSGGVKIFPLEPIIFSDGRKADRPVLLNKEGRPFQLVETGEGPDPLDRGRKIKTYEIKSPDDFGRPFTKAELEEATRHFRTKEKLNFTENLPGLNG